MDTKLIYMEQQNLLSTIATVVKFTQEEEGSATLILDQTIFYPQGGGQPYDQGTITSEHNAVFNVQEVRFKDGVVYHIGTTSDNFSIGQTVTLIVNQERRLFNRRNHTAGHLIDAAMKTLGYKLTPGRGYHFPDGAYVEYLQTIENEQERETIKSKLQSKLDQLVAQNLPVIIKMVSYEELQTIADHIPDYLPKNKPLRAVIIQGHPAVPCGGTHVNSTGDIKKITVTKIRSKKGCLKVSYVLEGNVSKN